MFLGMNLPVVFVMAVNPIFDNLITKLTSSDPKWGPYFLLAPLLFVLGLLIVFWLLRGMKSIVYIAKYKVKPVVPPA